MSFKVGDVVMAKSGGPVMTVCDVDTAGVHCKWHSKKEDKFNYETFPEAALDLYEGPTV